MSQMMDKARIEQLIRGAAFNSDLMLLQLRLRERKDQPPTFLELLNEIKTAEENELARRRIGTSVKSMNLKTDDNLESDVVKQLRAKEDPAASRGPDCFSKKGLTDVSEKECVPMGLVVLVSTISVELNGCPCSALLDSGSQVTIVFDQWHAQYLPQIPIQPLNGLSIWGLSACNYPYKGYILVDLSFPESLLD